MTKAILIESKRDEVKSAWIIDKYKEMQPAYDIVEAFNKDNYSTILLVLKSKFDGNVVVLNSGYDHMRVIENFKEVIERVKPDFIYTAILPHDIKKHIEFRDRIIEALQSIEAEIIDTIVLPE